ncbi:hypothetical protein E1B28_011505 [Marasmius oreades]|uniref:Heat shock factor binding protein 1 n=1 Tax=Marasmius oreades TaxID=181124 RepID=A0A9P7RU80_9AGAR|nr:uncharacterized protein E1B28_011505 [Marasmius oreades]KAG7089861.1 hypothetical protein E1B28_011505 [Marasmius oreades]
MTSTALPLKVPSTAPSKATENDAEKTHLATTKPKGNIGVNHISSPHELTAFVETLLEQLDSKFDEMSSQILERMSQMSTRVDALESSIQDIINGDVPASPTPGTPGIKRSDSATPAS